MTRKRKCDEERFLCGCANRKICFNTWFYVTFTGDVTKTNMHGKWLVANGATTARHRTIVRPTQRTSTRTTSKRRALRICCYGQSQTNKLPSLLDFVPLTATGAFDTPIVLYEISCIFIMPKVSKVGKFRRAKPQEVAAAKEEETSLSRGQRKRQAKREQYLKREQMILSTLRLKRKEEQKHRIDGLDALKEALSSATATAEVSKQEESSSQPTTNKKRKNLAAREMQHMSLVLQHPAFRENPLETIQQHLKNTLAGQAQRQQLKSQERTRQEQIKVQTEKEQKKEHGPKHRKKFHAARRTSKSSK